MSDQHMGMDPEVKRYFRKIINSFSYGLIWMIAVATTGLFMKLAIPDHGWSRGNFVFYGMALLTLFFLLRYYYRTWRD